MRRHVGFGVTPTFGIGGYFMVLDFNFSWSDIDALDKPAFVFNFGPRLGKNFTFKDPDRSLAVWVGGFRVKLNSGTSAARCRPHSCSRSTNGKTSWIRGI